MGRGTIEAVKEASPLMQLATVLVLAAVVGVQQGQGAVGTGRELADKEVMETKLASINATLGRIEDKLDPITRQLGALEIRLNALEREVGEGP